MYGEMFKDLEKAMYGLVIVGVAAGGLLVGAGWGVYAWIKKPSKRVDPKETPGVNLFGPDSPKEGVIYYPEGSQFIVTLHADGKTTIMAGPESGPWVFTGGRIRLISGTNSIVIEK